MALLDNQTLATQATCIDCNLPQGMQLAALIALFAKIANVSADPQSLVTMAACLQCAIPQGMQMSVLISLANQILNGGSSGGSACLYCGNGPPLTPAPCPCALYYSKDTLDFWVWISDTQQWQLLIGG